VFLRNFKGLWKAEGAGYQEQFTFITALDFPFECSKHRKCQTLININAFKEKTKLRNK
jgi:hypothetical protein